MPTVNLVNDFGGVGDGQRQTVTASITSGTGALTVGTSIFVVGDIGKAIAIWLYHPGTGATDYYLGTITGYTSGTQITVSPNITFAIPNGGDNSVDILWGTDNTSAFTGASGSWRAYAQAQTDSGDIPILEIPDGFYCLQSGAGGGGLGGGMHYNVLNSAKVTGLSGNKANCWLMQLANGEMRFGTNPAVRSNKGLANSGGNSVRLQTASAGDSTVTLTNPSGTDDGAATYGSRVVVGRTVLLASYDVQGLNDGDYGYPPNNMFFEWNRITAYNSGTGVATLETPLTQTHKSTYPQWCPDDTSFGSGHNSGSDQGGPFTMWVCVDGYNNTITLENITIDSPHNQCALHMRYWVANNISMNGGPGLYPTQNDIVEINDSVYSAGLEVDKLTNQVTWNNCTLNRLAQQSSSPNRMIVNGGTITTLDTGKYTEANGVDFGGGTIRLGAYAFGRTDRVVLSNCTNIGTFARGGASSDDLGGDTSAFFTFVGGVMRMAKTDNDGTQQNPTRGMPPGSWLLFDDKYIDQVTDVYEDGTYCYIQFANTTDWPFTPVARLLTHPCPDLTVTNCTGTLAYLEDWNSAPARRPWGSYSKRTLVGGPSSGTVTPQTSSPELMGRFVTESINVTVPYVGAGTLTIKDSQFTNRTYLKRSDWTTSSATFGSTVNMKVAGERVIRAATTATGAQTGDTLMNMTTPGEVNFTGKAAAGSIFSANVTNGETPTVIIEYIMDQGIPPAVPTAVVPLRLRLRQ